MGKLKLFFTKLHKSSKRNYLERMIDNKVNSMDIAKRYDIDYWDGDRKFGYGGYKYIKDHFKDMAINIINEYSLTNSSSILDIGCGKAFLLYEIKKLLPNITIAGLDISKYAISNAKNEIKQYLFLHDISSQTKFRNNEFDLVFSLGCLHNLKINNLYPAIAEINRIGKKSFLMVESYKNDQELFNLQCWALTCNSFFSVDEWLWIFKTLKYEGDYEFIYFE